MVDQDYIGVDVAKNWCDVCKAQGGHKRVLNTPEALAEFAHSAQGFCVVFEASGGYERSLMSALVAQGLSFVRVNPRQAREFARATGRLAKTDKVDAAVLQQMGAALRLKPGRAPDPLRQRLADLVARLQSLKAMRRMELNRMSQCQDPYIGGDIKAVIQVLDHRISRLDAEILATIRSAAHVEAIYRKLLSVPGIGPQIAAELLAGLPELGTLTRRQIAALAGLAPHAADSGLYRGKRRIWGGRKHIRRALYLAGFIASRYDPKLRAYRQKLQDNGKPSKVAIIATARKLLTILNQMIKTQEDYKPAI